MDTECNGDEFEIWGDDSAGDLTCGTTGGIHPPESDPQPAGTTIVSEPDWEFAITEREV